ncbi:MAG: phosphoribosylanthranilate isomerase [Acidobacteria bacterium]|nr:phosphoribosylanthranilate isomerase [Acidobacteriota bacterium]
MVEPAVPRIKICGVTTLRDAQMVFDAGADALGLIYAASVRQVVGPASGDIVRHLGERIWCVGVFRHQEDHEIMRVVERDELRAVQLHDPASEALLEALDARDVRVVRALSVDDVMLNAHERTQVVAVIVDGARPGSGVANDWRSLAQMSFDVPVIAAGGLDPENVAGVIAEVRPWGVDVASGVEYAHGVKDAAKVASFVARAREALTQKGAQ